MQTRQIISTLMTGIKAQKEQLPLLDHPFIPEMEVTERPELPFYTYFVYDWYNPQVYNGANNEMYTMKIQIKSHADNDMDAIDMANTVRKVLCSLDLHSRFRQQGLMVVTVDDLPNMDEKFATRFECVSGVDVQLQVVDDWIDQSQGGKEIKNIDLNNILKTKGEKDESNFDQTKF
jgi:hypothetical protein